MKIVKEPKSKSNNPIDPKPLIRIGELGLITLIKTKNITIATRQIKTVNNKGINFFVSKLRPPKSDVIPSKSLLIKKKLTTIPTKAIAIKRKLKGLLIER